MTSLEQYIEYLSYGATRANSQEWLNNRKFSIGCSEIAKACGTKVDQISIIKRKLNIDEMIRSPDPLIWGKLMEDSTKSFTEYKMGSVIETTPGSIKSTEFGFLSCSPDGLGIIKIPFSLYLKAIKVRHEKDYLKESKAINKEIINNYIDVRPSSDCLVPVLALYEFKSAFTKAPDGKIEIGYNYQVQGGLEVIKPARLGVFCKCYFGIVTNNVLNCPKNGTPIEQQNVPYFGGLKFLFIKAEADKEYYRTWRLADNDIPFEQYTLGKSTYYKEILGFSQITNSKQFGQFNMLKHSVDYFSIDIIEYTEDSIKLTSDFINYAKYHNLNIAQIEQSLLYWQTDKNVLLSVIRNQNYKGIRPFGWFEYRLADYQLQYVFRINDFIRNHAEKMSNLLNVVKKLDGMEPLEQLDSLDRIKSGKGQLMV